jgi:hypothetical protein
MEADTSTATNRLVETRKYISEAIAQDLETNASRLFEQYTSGSGRDEAIAGALVRLYQDRLLQSSISERKKWRYEYLSVAQSQATVLNAIEGATARFSIRFMETLPGPRLDELAHDFSISAKERDAARTLLKHKQEMASHDKLQPSLQFVQRANQLDLDETARRDTALFSCRREIRTSTPNGGQFLLAHAYDARARAIITNQILRRADEQSRGTVFNALSLPIALGEGESLIPPLIEAEIATAAAESRLKPTSGFMGLSQIPLGGKKTQAEKAEKLLRRRFDIFEPVFPAGGVSDIVDRESPKWDDLTQETKSNIPFGSWQQQIQFGIRATRLMANHQSSEEIKLFNRRFLHYEQNYGLSGPDKISSVYWRNLIEPAGTDRASSSIFIDFNDKDRASFEKDFFDLWKLKDLVNAGNRPPGTIHRDDDLDSIFGWRNGGADLATKEDLLYPFAFYRLGAIAGSALMLYKYAYCMWAITRNIAANPGRVVSDIIKMHPVGNMHVKRYLQYKNEVAAVINMSRGGFPLAFDVNNKDDECFYFAMGESFDFRRYYELVEGKEAIFEPDGTVFTASLRDLGRFRFASWKPPATLDAETALKMGAQQRVAAHQAYTGTMNLIKVLGGDRTSRRTFLGNMARNVAGGFIAQFLTGLHTMQTLPSFPGMVSAGISRAMNKVLPSSALRPMMVDLVVYLGAEPLLAKIAQSSLIEPGPRIRGALGVISCLIACGPTRLLVDVARNWMTRAHQSMHSLYALEAKINFDSQLMKQRTSSKELQIHAQRIQLAIAAASYKPITRDAADPNILPTFLPIRDQTLEQLQVREEVRVGVPDLTPFTGFTQMDMARRMAVGIGASPLYDMLPDYLNRAATQMRNPSPALIKSFVEFNQGVPGVNWWDSNKLGMTTEEVMKEGADFSRLNQKVFAHTVETALRYNLDRAPNLIDIHRQDIASAMSRVLLHALPAGTEGGDWLRSFSRTIIESPYQLFQGPEPEELVKLGVFKWINATILHGRPSPFNDPTIIVPDPTNGGFPICQSMPDIATVIASPTTLSPIPENQDVVGVQTFGCYLLHSLHFQAQNMTATAPIPPSAAEIQRGQETLLESIYQAVPSVFAQNRERSAAPSPQNRAQIITQNARIRAGMQSWWDILETPLGAGPLELATQLVMGQTGATHQAMFEASQQRVALYSAYTRGMLFDQAGETPSSDRVPAMFPNVAIWDWLYRESLKMPHGVGEKMVRPMRNFLLMTTELLTDPHGRGHGWATYSSLRASYGLAHTLFKVFEGRAILEPFGQLPGLVRSFALAIDRTSFAWEHHFANVDLIQRFMGGCLPSISTNPLSFPAVTLINAIAIGMVAFMESFCDSAQQTADDYLKLALQILRDQRPELSASDDQRKRDVKALLDELNPTIANGLVAWKNLILGDSKARQIRLGPTVAALSTRNIIFWQLSQSRYLARWLFLPQLPMHPIVGSMLQVFSVLLTQFDLTRIVTEWLGDIVTHVSWAGIALILCIAWYWRRPLFKQVWKLIVQNLGPLIFVVLTIYAIPFTALIVDGLIGWKQGPVHFLVSNTGWLTYNLIWSIPNFMTTSTWWLQLKAQLEAIVPSNETPPGSLREDFTNKYWGFLLFNSTRKPIEQPTGSNKPSIVLRSREPMEAAERRELFQSAVSLFGASGDEFVAANAPLNWAALRSSSRIRPAMESGLAEYDLARQDEAMVRDGHMQLLECRSSISSLGYPLSLPVMYGDQQWPFLRNLFVDREGLALPATGDSGALY